jgi:transposase
MSTSLLYHGFGIKGYHHVNTKYEGGAVRFTIRQETNKLPCSSCGARHVLLKGQVWRQFRDLPIGKKPVWITLGIHRVYCQACELIRQVKVGFAEPRRSYTRGFERYALDLGRQMTIQDVSRHLGVSWDVIKDIQKRNLEKRFSRPTLKHLKQIAIDEISIGKGHKYLTIVLDLESGAVVFVGDGRGSDALLPFLKRLKRSCATIEAVAIDMSPAYIAAVTEHLPDAAIVFDHFHVIKLFNDKLSDFRRKLHREANHQEQRVLKGTRWLLLKNPENLKPEKDEPERLMRALELNQPLACAYYMKEDLRRLWSFPTKQKAESFLFDWTKRAWTSGITMLSKFADTFMAHREGILAYYDYPISTGPLEGTNNKIKTMKRQAYGFRDNEFFKLKIMSIHKSRYALVG